MNGLVFGHFRLFRVGKLRGFYDCALLLNLLVALSALFRVSDIPIGVLEKVHPTERPRLERLQDEIVVESHAGLECGGAPRHHGADELYRLRLPVRQIDDIAAVVLSTAPCAPRHLNILVRIQHTHSVGGVVILAETGEDDGLCRHINTDGERLCGEEDLHEAAAEQNLHALLENGDEAAVMIRNALFQERTNGVILRNALELLAVGMEMEVHDVANGGGI